MKGVRPVANLQPNTRDWSYTEFVKEHIAAAGDFVRDVFIHRETRFCGYAKTESPLESVFLVWWSALAKVGEISGSMVECHRQQEVTVGDVTYRLDFTLTPEGPLCFRGAQLGLYPQKIAIELDGHDFHERTKEQVAYRNQRDRDLLAAGWKVLHFSGSEIHRRPDECVREAFGIGMSAYDEFERSIWEAEAATA
jgi:hypothetical protein